MTDVAAPLKTTFFNAIYETLPSVLKNRVDGLLTEQARSSGGGGSDGDAAGDSTRLTFDRLLRFSLGAIHSEEDGGSQAEWNEAQSKLENVLSNLKTAKGKKRDRDDDNGGGGGDGETVQQASKKTKLDPGLQSIDVDDSPIFTLHSFSVAVPVRKKVDITIRQRSICFTNPTTETVESIVQTETLTRAFLLSTPGKTKAHWTVILLANTEQNQVIFGTDDLLPSLKTTTHPEPLQTNPKGTSAEASLRKFLSHLPSNTPLLEPSTSHFRSDNGEPWLDTYLRAKEGHLFFFQSGILFGLKKPCIWIGMEEINNVRTLSVTGRTFSVFITRQPKNNTEQDEEGEETEFSMIDGKHQDSVSKWVRSNQHLFGVARDEQQQQLEQSADPEETEQNPNQNADLDDESDDSDFHSGSDSDGGSPSSASSSEENDEEGEEGGNDSGSAEEEDTEGEGEAEDEDEPLDPSKHPLMAPGAVPRLSKAAMDAVIGMVERDLKGGNHSTPTNGHEIDELGDEDDEEIDQLD